MTRGLFRSKIVYRSLTLAFLFLVTLSVSAQWSSPQEEGRRPGLQCGASAEGHQAAADPDQG